MQLAPISIPTSVSSSGVISAVIRFKYFHFLIIFGVAISSLSTGRKLLEYALGTLIHSTGPSLPQLIADTLKPFTAASSSDFSPVKVFRFYFSFLPVIPSSSMISSLIKDPLLQLSNIPYVFTIFLELLWLTQTATMHILTTSASSFPLTGAHLTVSVPDSLGCALSWSSLVFFLCSDAFQLGEAQNITCILVVA